MIIPVPPVVLKVTVPSATPLHDTLVELTTTFRLCEGAVTSMLDVYIQPLASVTVTVYVPAVSPVAVVVPCGGTEFHDITYGAVPPATPLIVAVPLLPPRQLTLVAVSGSAVMAVGAVMVTLHEVVHRFASVTITV